jgi:predicted esterase
VRVKTSMNIGTRSSIAVGLVVLLGWCGGAVAQVDVPLSSRQLSRDFTAAHSAGDYAKAIEIGRKWTRFNKRDSGAAYNLACAYALHGDKPKAFEWLNKSVDRGWDDASHMRVDTDLDSLRDLPEFAAIIERVMELRKPKLDKARTSEPIVILPPNHDKTKAATVIVALHGYGSNADSFSSTWKETAAEMNAILVVPRAITSVSENGYSWDAIDVADAIVSSALEQVKKSHKVAEGRVVLTGFSQGGYMAFNLGRLHPDRFAGVIPVAGMFVPASASPSGSSTKNWPKYFIMIGDADRERTVESNRQATDVLRSAGVSVKLKTYPGLGHQFPPDHTKELVKAVRFVLGGSS